MKKFGKIQLRILYWLYLPENKGGLNHSPSDIIKNSIGSGTATYPALKSLRKQGYIGIGYYDGIKGEIWGKTYFITSYGRKIFKENMKNKSYSEMKKILNEKNPLIYWE